ncbi:hypothetical protein OHT52_30760 [Streptomyces sp. NBC_00247]|uniref:nucleotidyltransferase domain-containing protein n=1 Tax=Streptomyces sp. NBC_00247 TaxID=2975689 RepID=UPI002E2993E5|nr:hypothetical protein [Streptomyces sp. NBC_00247]
MTRTRTRTTTPNGSRTGRPPTTDIWIGGGRGINALVGEPIRKHRDLDLAHRNDQEPGVIAAFSQAGFAGTVEGRAVRFVVTDPGGREIDLRPLLFAADGSASLDPGPSGVGCGRTSTRRAGNIAEPPDMDGWTWG